LFATTIRWNERATDQGKETTKDPANQLATEQSQTHTASSLSKHLPFAVKTG